MSLQTYKTWKEGQNTADQPTTAVGRMRALAEKYRTMEGAPTPEESTGTSFFKRVPSNQEVIDWANTQEDSGMDRGPTRGGAESFAAMGSGMMFGAPIGGIAALAQLILEAPGSRVPTEDEAQGMMRDVLAGKRMPSIQHEDFDTRLNKAGKTLSFLSSMFTYQPKTKEGMEALEKNPVSQVFGKFSKMGPAIAEQGRTPTIPVGDVNSQEALREIVAGNVKAPTKQNAPLLEGHPNLQAMVASTPEFALMLAPFMKGKVKAMIRKGHYIEHWNNMTPGDQMAISLAIDALRDRINPATNKPFEIDEAFKLAMDTHVDMAKGIKQPEPAVTPAGKPPVKEQPKPPVTEEEPAATPPPPAFELPDLTTLSLKELAKLRAKLIKTGRLEEAKKVIEQMDLLKKGTTAPPPVEEPPVPPTEPPPANEPPPTPPAPPATPPAPEVKPTAPPAPEAPAPEVEPTAPVAGPVTELPEGESPGQYLDRELSGANLRYDGTVKMKDLRRVAVLGQDKSGHIRMAVSKRPISPKYFSKLDETGAEARAYATALQSAVNVAMDGDLVPLPGFKKFVPGAAIEDKFVSGTKIAKDLNIKAKAKAAKQVRIEELAKIERMSAGEGKIVKTEDGYVVQVGDDILGKTINKRLTERGFADASKAVAAAKRAGITVPEQIKLTKPQRALINDWADHGWLENVIRRIQGKYSAYEMPVIEGRTTKTSMMADEIRSNTTMALMKEVSKLKPAEVKLLRTPKEKLGELTDVQKYERAKLINKIKAGMKGSWKNYLAERLPNVKLPRRTGQERGIHSETSLDEVAYKQGTPGGDEVITTKGDLYQNPEEAGFQPIVPAYNEIPLTGAQLAAAEAEKAAMAPSEIKTLTKEEYLKALRQEAVNRNAARENAPAPKVGEPYYAPEVSDIEHFKREQGVWQAENQATRERGKFAYEESKKRTEALKAKAKERAKAKQEKAREQKTENVSARKTPEGKRAERPKTKAEAKARGKAKRAEATLKPLELKFKPSKKLKSAPESVEAGSAVIEYNGKYYGPSAAHPDIVFDMVDKLGLKGDEATAFYDAAQRRFVTTHGRIVTPEEAITIREKAGLKTSFEEALPEEGGVHGSDLFVSESIDKDLKGRPAETELTNAGKAYEKSKKSVEKISATEKAKKAVTEKNKVRVHTPDEVKIVQERVVKNRYGTGRGTPEWNIVSKTDKWEMPAGTTEVELGGPFKTKREAAAAIRFAREGKVTLDGIGDLVSKVERLLTEEKVAKSDAAIAKAKTKWGDLHGKKVSELTDAEIEQAKKIVHKKTPISAAEKADLEAVAPKTTAHSRARGPKKESTALDKALEKSQSMAEKVTKGHESRVDQELKKSAKEVAKSKKEGKGGYTLYSGIPFDAIKARLLDPVFKRWEKLIDYSWNKLSNYTKAKILQRKGMTDVASAFINDFGLTKAFKFIERNMDLANHQWNIRANYIADQIKHIDGTFKTATREMTVGKTALEKRMKQVAGGSITAFNEKFQPIHSAAKKFNLLEKELSQRGLLKDHQFRRLTNKQLAKTFDSIKHIESRMDSIVEQMVNLEKTNPSSPKIRLLADAFKNLHMRRLQKLTRIQIHYKNAGKTYYRLIQDRLQSTSDFRKFASYKLDRRYALMRDNWRVIANDDGTVTVLRQGAPMKNKSMKELTTLVRKGISEEAHDVNMYDMFDRISKSNRWASDSAKPNWTKMPKDVERYGSLAGKYLAPEVYNHIKSITHLENIFTKSLSKVFTKWKKAKVTWNPAAQMRNIISNFMLADVIADVPFMDDVFVDGFKYAIKNMRGEFFEKGTEFYNIKFNTLISKSTFAKAELGQYNTFLDHAELQLKYGKPMEVFDSIMEFPGELYNMVEEGMKAGVYLKWRERGASVYKAEQMAMKALFDYGKVPPAIAWARRFYSPFVTFAYKSIPALASGFIKKPYKMAKYYIAFKALETLTRAALGESPEDMERERAVLPEYAQGDMLGGIPKHIRVPWTGPNGEAKYLDLSYIVPWGQWDEGTGPFKFLPRAIMPQNPLLNLWADTEANENIYLDQPLTLKFEDSGEQILKLLAYAGKTAAPGILDPGKIAKIARAVRGDKNIKGTGYSVAEAMIDYAMGLKIRTFDFATELNFRRAELTDEQDELSQWAAKQYEDIYITHADNWSEEKKAKKANELYKRVADEQEDILNKLYFYLNMNQSKEELMK